MPRAATTIPGPTVAFSVRHLRRRYRDKLRVYGTMLELNMEEALDRALKVGLAALEEAAMGREDVPDAE